MASAVIGALRVNLSADTAAFSAGLRNAEGRLSSFGRAVTPAINRLAAFGAAAAAAAAAVVVALTKSAFSSIDAQSKLAQRLGATTAAVQALEHAADLAGVSSEALTSSADRLNRKLGEVAKTGKGPAFEALQALGLSAKQLSELDADERLATLADAMADAGYSAQQMSATLADLGIKQAAVNNLLQGGGAAIREARAEVVRYGIAVSDIDATKVEAANDAWTRAMAAVKGVITQLTIQLAPIIEAIAVAFTDAAASGQGFAVQIAGGVKTLIQFFAELNNRILTTRKEFVGLMLLAAKAQQVGGALLNPFTFGNPSEAVDRLQKELDELNSQTMPSKEVEKWFEDLEAAANKAALQVAVTRAAARKAAELKGTTPAETEADREEREKAEKEAELEAERMATRLEALRTSLLTEAEAEKANYDQRLAQLDEFLKAGIITSQEYADLKARAEQEYLDAGIAREKEAADRRSEIEERHRKEQIDRDREAAALRLSIFSGYMDSFAGILTGIAGVIGEEGKKQFEISKALSLASATIKGIEAVISSYAAGAAIGGPPLGAAFAAAAAAATAAQLAMISRQQFQGGGGGAGAINAAGAAAASTPAVAPSGGSPQQVMYLHINGQQFGRPQVEDLARQLIEFQKDGGKVILK